MLESKVVLQNGIPCLEIDGKIVSAMAYTTYFEERSAYLDFIKAGYKIFFVNLTFTTSPINSASSGFTPFSVGVFENIDEPDYSEFEDAVRKILKACPDAVIFPRIYVSMPKWWVEQNGSECAPTPKGGDRELLFSRIYRRDGSELLKKTVEHIKASDYSHRIGGWQLVGGQTQEWFCHDFWGSICDNSLKYYSEWLEKKHSEMEARLPSKECYISHDLKNTDENGILYSEFCSEEIAATVDHFSRVVKEATDFSQIVGIFYGYSLSVANPLSGTHGLRIAAESENIDYFSSPNCYTHARPFGIDWSDMIPVDSVKLRNKLCFIECDIRTYLTKSIQESRPGRYPDTMYKTAANAPSVWAGPPTALLSREALRKCFAHQITKASAIWWFDMWGGWYDDPLLMDEMQRMYKIYAALPDSPKGGFECEAVLFADERAMSNLSMKGSKEFYSESRIAMGNTAVPFDCYLVEDAAKVVEKYKAAVFIAPFPSKEAKDAMALCDRLGIPYISASEEKLSFTADELRSFFEKCSLHLYSDELDVVYLGNGYLALHSSKAGKKQIKLPKNAKLDCVFGAKDFCIKETLLTFDLEENATALFSFEN